MLTDKQRKACKHKIIIINPLYSKIYCKRCKKNLSDNKNHDFVTKKIKQGKFDRSYKMRVEVWDD